MKFKPLPPVSPLESLDLAKIHVNKIKNLCAGVAGDLDKKSYMNAADTLRDINQSVQLVAGYVNKLMTKVKR